MIVWNFWEHCPWCHTSRTAFAYVGNTLSTDSQLAGETSLLGCVAFALPALCSLLDLRMIFLPLISSSHLVKLIIGSTGLRRNCCLLIDELVDSWYIFILYEHWCHLYSRGCKRFALASGDRLPSLSQHDTSDRLCQHHLLLGFKIWRPKVYAFLLEQYSAVVNV